MLSYRFTCSFNIKANLKVGTFVHSGVPTYFTHLTLLPTCETGKQSFETGKEIVYFSNMGTCTAHP